MPSVVEELLILNNHEVGQGRHGVTSLTNIMDGNYKTKDKSS